MNFSIYIPSSPNAAFASCFALFQASSRSSSFQTNLIPFPPPPAVAFNITGYPTFSEAIFLHSSKLPISPSDPGMVGTPAFFIVSFAAALSPIPSIISGEAPINLILFSVQILEKFEFSAKNPYPG